MGSRVRADLITLLVASRARALAVADLARVVRHPHQPVDRQMRRLVQTGLVRRRSDDGRAVYEWDETAPAARELAALIRQTRGRVPRIRHALVSLRTPTLAWALPSARGDAAYEVVVLTAAPRSMVRVQLADLVSRDCEIRIMPTREWVARLDKGDVDLRRLRRTRKLWILGTWEQLVASERAVLESKRLLQRAMANWQEELSDDWDDSWDPFQPSVALAR